MMRAVRRYKTENFWKITRGRYLKSETKNYVPKIMALAIIGKNLKSFGFEDVAFQDTLDFEIVSVPGEMDLYNVAEALGTTYEEVHRWNPEILRWITPPAAISYDLKLPYNLKEKWLNCCATVASDFRASDYQTYRVRGRKSTLKDVAKKFKVKPYVLEKLNGFKSWTLLKRRQKVLLPFRLGQSKKDKMYADLYERPRKSVRRRRAWRRQLKLALKKGRKISAPQQWYTVKKGDTLWEVARKNNIALYTLMRTNYSLLRKRMIRAEIAWRYGRRIQWILLN